MSFEDDLNSTNNLDKHVFFDVKQSMSLLLLSGTTMIWA